MKEIIRYRYIWFALIVSILVVNVTGMLGCTTEHRFFKLQNGMPEAEVREIMGEPYSKSGHSGEGRSYYWTWHVWFEPMHVVVAEFSAEGTVKGLTEQ